MPHNNFCHGSELWIVAAFAPSALRGERIGMGGGERPWWRCGVVVDHAFIALCVGKRAPVQQPSRKTSCGSRIDCRLNRIGFRRSLVILVRNPSRVALCFCHQSLYITARCKGGVACRPDLCSANSWHNLRMMTNLYPHFWHIS
jgi:hypothetical protein